LSDIDPPNGYRISGEGSGGVAGFAKGGATVTLTPDGPDATNLHYTVDAQIGGKLAQLGSRLMDATAKKLAGEFFAAFATEAASVEAPVAPQPQPHPATPSGGILARCMAALLRWLGLASPRAKGENSPAE
jgi:hypothetical protein